MSSNVPSLGIPSTSCLLSDVNLRFAIAEDIVTVEDEPSVCMGTGFVREWSREKRFCKSMLTWECESNSICFDSFAADSAGS
jgi:hypothetical protein